MYERFDVSIRQGLNGYYFVRVNGALLASFKYLQDAQLYVKSLSEQHKNVGKI